MSDYAQSYKLIFLRQDSPELFGLVLDAFRSHGSGFSLRNTGFLGYSWIVSSSLEKPVLSWGPWHLSLRAF